MANEVRRTLAVGWFDNGDFIRATAPFLPRIREVFFAWPGVLSCRPAPDYTEQLRARQIAELRWCRENGILLDTLFNANCYGDIAISPELADFVTRILEEMRAEDLLPEIVTTTSPFIATVLRQRYPEIKIRWSVNTRVVGTLGFESVEELCDSFYAYREMQRDFDYLKRTAQWATAHGKVFGLQANSGCLRACPFQTFHDNLHGHNRIRQSAVGASFDFSVFRCKTNYERGNYEDFVRATWIRPEDLPRYEEYVQVVKIATRRHPDPAAVIKAYATYSYEGDLAKLMDPVHNFPKSFDNRSFDNSVLWREVEGCKTANDCMHCGRCSRLMEQVFK